MGFNSEEPTQPERSINHYQLVSSLGKGGMGEVYLARDLKLGRNVSIKILPTEFTKDPGRVRRFKQEARSASSLNHPNIITVHEIGESAEGHFIVMEYVEGQTLRALNQPISLDSLIRIGRQIAEALRVAHASGIVHRDIKPENIMVRTDGYVKVLDFGLARLFADNERNQSITRTGVVFGTPRYMSPEQMRGEKTNSASDIFSFGMVLYELATGQHPGMPDTIATRVPPAASTLNSQVPIPLDRLILQMLNRDALLRPAAAEVEEALQKFSPSLPGQQTGVFAPSHHTVGREKEQTSLTDRFASVSAGRGMLLCVSGEPGIGKTTLVKEFLSEVETHHQPCQIAYGRCSERLAGAEAYLPWLEALDTLLRGPNGETIARSMKRLAPSWHAQLVSAGDKSPTEEHVGSQQRLKRELTSFLIEICQLQPLVLFFDDVHWSDVSTVDLLSFVAAKFETIRVLIIATYRPSELQLVKHPFLQLKAELQGKRLCNEIQLKFLCSADIERYLMLEFPNHQFPPEFLKLIYEKTEGSPLFMVDLTRYLSDRNVITEIDGVWTLSKSVLEFETELPESMRAMIGRKIEQLTEEQRRLLIAASVQGYEFDSAVVAQVLTLDPSEVEESLEQLERIYGFVRSVETKEFPDRTLTVRYRFIHVLYQNALYALLQPTRKAQLNSAVARALLKYYDKQNASIASELAKLFEAARDFSSAVTYYLIAAQNAAKIFAYQETITLTRLGLQLLKSLPESEERNKQELDFHLVQGPTLGALKGYAVPDVEEVYTRAFELCRGTNDTVKLFTVQYNLWLIHDLKANIKICRQLSEECLALSRRSQDTALLLMGHAARAESLLWSGEFRLSLSHSESGQSLYDLQQHRSLAVLHAGYDQGVICTLLAAHSLWFLGYADQALMKAHEQVTLAHKLGDPHTLALALIHQAFHFFLRREIKEARKVTESVLALANDQGLPFYVAYATAFRGRALVNEDKNDEGISQMYEGIAAYRSTGSEIERPFLVALLAEACGKTGQVEDGISVLSEMLEEINDNDDRFYEAELYRLKGTLLLQKKTPDESEAENCFHRAIKIANQQNAKSLELRAATSLFQLWQSHGKKDQALQMLVPIYSWFTEGFETTDLKEANSLIGENLW